MYSVGRICIKLAGRDAGNEAVIIDILDDKYVLIDGNVRRRKCNILHLEPTSKKIEMRKNASHDDIVKAFKECSLETWSTKPRQKTERPVKQRGKKAPESPKESKKAAKKEKKAIKDAVIVEEKKAKETKKKAAAKEEKTEGKKAVKKKAAKKEDKKE